MQDYGKIVVLAGGNSSEREISLESGRAVFRALKSRKLDAKFVDLADDIYAALQALRADIVFIALHGRFGEDGTVQAMLDELQICYTGSAPEASRLALDKIASRVIFLKNGLAVPPYRIVNRNRDVNGILSGLEAPFVVKPQHDGPSVGGSVDGGFWHDGDWGLGIGDWRLTIACQVKARQGCNDHPTPETLIPNP